MLKIRMARTWWCIKSMILPIRCRRPLQLKVHRSWMKALSDHKDKVYFALKIPWSASKIPTEIRIRKSHWKPIRNSTSSENWSWSFHPYFRRDAIARNHVIFNSNSSYRSFLTTNGIWAQILDFCITILFRCNTFIAILQ